MHITLSWLRLGDGSPVHGFQIFFSLTIKKQAFRCLQTLQVRLTASITVGHATDREHVQICVPTVKGALRNPRTASVRLRYQPLSPIHSSWWGTTTSTKQRKQQ
jgi:hypothetical protein